jgi:hypothetical protein
LVQCLGPFSDDTWGCNTLKLGIPPARQRPSVEMAADMGRPRREVYVRLHLNPKCANIDFKQGAQLLIP